MNETITKMTLGILFRTLCRFMKKNLTFLILIFGLSSAFSQGSELTLLLVPIPGNDGYYGQLADSSGLYIGPVIQIAHQAGQAFLRSPTGTIVTAEVGAATTTFSMYAEEASKAVSDVILGAAKDEATEEESGEESLDESEDEPENETDISESGPPKLTTNTTEKIKEFIELFSQGNSTGPKPLSHEEIIAFFKEEAKKSEMLKQEGYEEEEIVAAYYLVLDSYLQESGRSIHSISVDDLRSILLKNDRWTMLYVIRGAESKYYFEEKILAKLTEWAKNDPVNGIYRLTEENIASAYYATIPNNSKGYKDGSELYVKNHLIKNRSKVIERLNVTLRKKWHQEKNKGKHRWRWF